MSDSSASLDYFFGWRWLLPTTKPGSPGVVIADKRSSEFLLAALSLRPPASGDEAPLLVVIDADLVLANPEVFNPKVMSGADTIVAYGTDSAVTRVAKYLTPDQHETRIYGLIPPSSPRVVVPLGDQSSTLFGLGLHRPGRSLAKLAVMGLKVLARLGFVWPLRRSRLLIASGRSARPALLETNKAITVDGQDFALYLGVAGSARKTIALPVGKTVPQWIIKSAELPAARSKLANEARMLGELANTALAECVPSLHSFHSSASASVLVQQYFRASTKNGSNLDAAVREFLTNAAGIGTSQIPIKDFIASQISLPTEKAEISEDRIAKAAVLLSKCAVKFSEILIPIGFTHGDFAPWNCLLEKTGLRVFDWEDGSSEGLFIGDAFNYVVMQRLLLRQDRNAVRIANEAVGFAKSIYGSQDIGVEQVEACFVIWCLSRIDYPFGEIYPEMANYLLNTTK